jgi:hypothetical protein
MTRRGFLSSIAAAVASPKVVADAAIATAAAAAIDEPIAAADAKFVAAVETALFGDRRMATEAVKRVKATEAAK